MRRLIVESLLAGVLFGVFAPTLRADVSAKQVRDSIDKAVAYLKQQQRSNGLWPEYAGGIGYPGGTTALCTLALLNAGVEPDDPHVQRALSQLRKLPPTRTYVVALQTMVLAQAEPKADLLLIRENVKWLEDHQAKTGNQLGGQIGGWNYGSMGSVDNSNSQFALLALHEAERVGVQVQSRTWRLAKAYWEHRNAQKADGSWGYTNNSRGSGTGSMTCAGIASLVIVRDKIRQNNAKVTGSRIECCQQGDEQDDHIRRGLDWLGRNFSVTRNPGHNHYLLYYLYGVERVGRLTARRFIGGHDWYREGCEELIRAQDSLSGFIKGAKRPEDDPLVGTSFALLFLSKGRRPPLLAKLRHSRDDDWNAHQNDVDNLTRFVESQWELDLTWQVVDLRGAKVEDLLQAPVAYLCGGSNLLPDSPAAQQRLARLLRDYLDRGGFVFAEAYRNDTGFDDGFRQLIDQVFPEPEYRLRLLEAEHPIWHAERRVAAEQVRPLWGIEFGCRTSVIYAPPDRPRPSLSCLWELARTGRGRRFAPEVRAQIDGGLAIGINVLAYATNRELQPKEELFAVRTTSQVKDTVERGRLAIAKLRHPGGCNAAPRALINLLETAGRELKLRVDTSENLIRITDAALFNYHLVFMHGRNRFHLTEEERQQLKTYLERGGMLFADAICGRRPFVESFRREMTAVLPEGKLEPIPPDDPIWTSAYGGEDLETVTRRDPQRASNNGRLTAKLRKGPPQLQGIRLKDRWAVVFSPYDISCALERHDSLECHGYVRQDAARIGLNVVLYSLQQ